MHPGLQSAWAALLISPHQTHSPTLQDTKSRSWLVRTYYSNRLFMGYCCVCCEVLYLVVSAQGWGPQR